MDENGAMKPKKGIAVKILIPLLVVVAIAAVWVFKNMKPANQPADVGHPDFALKVTDTLDLEQLKSHGLPILVEFGSEDCPACKVMAPIIEQLNADLQGKAIIKYADVWADPSLADGFPLTVIPTQLFIDSEGKPYSPADPKTLGMKLYLMRETEEHVYTVHEGTLTREQLLGILEEMGMQ